MASRWSFQTAAITTPDLPGSNLRASDLRGVRIGLTRARGSGEALRNKLIECGAVVNSFALIAIETSQDQRDALQRVAHCLDEYALLLFTSANAVSALVANATASQIVGKSCAVVGPATKKCAYECGFDVAIAGDSTGAELAEAISRNFNGNERILYVRAEVAASNLGLLLRENNFTVDEVVAYSNLPLTITESQLHDLTSCDCIVFASPSAVNAYFANVEPIGHSVANSQTKPVAVCIGPTTERAASDVSQLFSGVMTATSPTDEAIIQTIGARFKKR